MQQAITETKIESKQVIFKAYTLHDNLQELDQTTRLS